MKAGSLVRWIHPDAPDTGLITEVSGDQVYVCWIKEPECSGWVPGEHELLMEIAHDEEDNDLEVIDESR